jgi:circadian clock protein KaiC
MTKTKSAIARLETGVRNLDELYSGGIPKGSVLVIGGPPGAGKTILTQQMCFHNVSAEQPVIYFSTLSEPTAKTLRYLDQFTFFDAAKMDAGMHFVDLGMILRAQGLDEASRLIMEQIKRVKPAIVVIDSFKVFDDMAKSQEELRKFGYELAVNLMAWETTTFLLGEYGPHDISTNPLFSIIDGLLLVTQREQSGEQQRFMQAIKMRGTLHSRDEHPFVITANGIEVFAPRVTIRREDRGPGGARCQTGVSKLDELLGDGIPRGSSLLIGGVAGTGKTILLLEFLYRGALAGEKGIIFSFEETSERLLASARGLGWDFEGEIARGMIEIVFIAQPDIMVEGHLLMMRERVERLQAKRVAIDSVSVFLHKVKDPQIAREKVFQLASIIQNTQAVGFLATDIPYGSSQLSRFGVEETVVDGVILLTSIEEGFERQRYIDVYKLRNTAHLKGRHSMVIGPGGLTIFPRYGVGGDAHEPPPGPDDTRRLASGVPGLDALLGGGLLGNSVTLVSGSAGIGKTTLGLQFVLEGVKRGEPGLYVALEEGPGQILATATSLGLPLAESCQSGECRLLYLSREQARPGQLLALLDDAIKAHGAQRIVLDGVSNIMPGEAQRSELRQLLYALAVRFKARGVTTLLTLESDSMYDTNTITERGYSPVADNIIMLRYAQVTGQLLPTLSVVKTRGSAHDRSGYYFTVSQGGIRLTGTIAGGPPPAKARRSPKKVGSRKASKGVQSRQVKRGGRR